MLKALGDIKAPEFINFDRASLKSEIEARILSNPDYANIYDGDLYQNASQMVLNFFTFLYEKNAEEFNRVVNENFLQNCKANSSIYAHLRERRIETLQDKAASVVVDCYLKQNLTNSTNTVLQNSLIISRTTKVTAKGLDGSIIPFSFIAKDDNGKYKYFSDIVITPTDSTRDHFIITLYAGETFNEEITIPTTGIENTILSLSNHENIVEGSVVVYYKNKNGLLIELPQTTTFIKEKEVDATGVFANGKPYCMLNYTANGSATITFGSSEFGGTLSADQYASGESLVIYGRKNGGGKYANIVSGAINTNLVFQDTQANYYSYNIYNNQYGAGGVTRESAEEARKYAPLRCGRGGAIIDETDAKSALRQYTVRHDIELSNVDGETSQTVPILHVFHKIVPIRDFTDFALPVVEDDDTYETWMDKFTLAVNSFCNINGINSDEVINQYVTSFVPGSTDSANKYGFTTKITGSVPLFGTLYLNALDYNGKIVDRVSWSGSYSGNSIVSASLTEHATFTTSFFVSLSIIAKVNDEFKFYFGNNPSKVITIKNIVSGTRTPTTLANEFQTKIIEAIANDETLNATYSAYLNFTFAKYISGNDGTGAVQIICPYVGEQSRIVILDNGLKAASTYDLNTLFGVSLYNGQSTPYRPTYETGLVFDSDNVYYPPTQDVDVKILTAPMDNLSKIYTISPVQSISSANGQVITYQLLEEDLATITKVQENTNVLVTFSNSDGSFTETDIFENVASVTNNAISEAAGGSKVIKGSKCFFDQTTGTFTLQLADAIQSDVYKQSFSTITAMKLYQMKLDTDGITYIADTAYAPIVFYETNGAWQQPRYTKSFGTILSLPQQLDSTQTYGLFVYTVASGVESLMQTILFKNISLPSSIGINYGTLTEEAIKVDSNQPVMINSQKLITINFADGEINADADKEYVAGYTSFSTVAFTYYRKSYDKITVNYHPNIYNPTGEAKTMLDLLKSKSKRLLSIEHLLKPLDFVPTGIHISATILANYSTDAAKAAIKSAVEACLGFNSLNDVNIIGTKPTEDTIRMYILANIGNIGLTKLEIVDYTKNITASDVDNAYYFVFGDTVKQQLSVLEANNSILSGITALTTITIDISRTA